MAQLEDDGSQKERRMGNFCILCTVWKNKKFALTWKIKYFVKLIHISIGTVLLVKKLLSRKSLWNNCESKVLQFPHCARPTLPSIQSIRNIIFAQLRRCFWNVWNLLTFSISNIFLWSTLYGAFSKIAFFRLLHLSLFSILLLT